MTSRAAGGDAGACRRWGLRAAAAGLALLSACSPASRGIVGYHAREVTPSHASTPPVTARPMASSFTHTTAAAFPPTPTTTTAAPAITSSSTSTTTTTTTAAARGWIALTWDDGPVPGAYVILDILDAYGVKTTFFVSAWRLPANAEIAREIIRRGHSLQSHGFMHNRWPEMSDHAVRRDIERANQLIFAATGYTPTCIRPPFGSTSHRTTAIAESLGMQVVIWDENSADYAHQSSAALLRDAPTWEPNSVVLAHDTNHYVWSPVLAQIIQGLQERDLEFVALCGYQRTPKPRLQPL
ncbi:MAG: polysaccharide deacetylase family protein [Actinomycetota bacterium]